MPLIEATQADELMVTTMMSTTTPRASIPTSYWRMSFTDA